MKKIARNTKETTLNDLAGTIDNLAIMVAKGFDRVEGRIDRVEKDISEVKKDVDEIKENLAGTRRDVLNIGDRFVPRHEFHDFLVRFNKSEQKVKGK